eukprot:scaffold130865_cov69-Phaeocystis_antarctica.AAC.1
MSRWRSLLPARLMQGLPTPTKPRRRHSLTPLLRLAFQHPPRTRSRARSTSPQTSLHLFAWMAQELRPSLMAVPWTGHCPRQRPSSVGSNAPAAEPASRGRQLRPWAKAAASVTTKTKPLLPAPTGLSGGVGTPGPLNRRGLHRLARSGPECISARSAMKTVRTPPRPKIPQTSCTQPASATRSSLLWRKLSSSLPRLSLWRDRNVASRRIFRASLTRASGALATPRARVKPIAVRDRCAMNPADESIEQS